MDFENICPSVDTVIDLPLRDKRALLHDLGHRAALALNVDGAIVFNALLKREELGSTGIGNGVAIPHVRLEQVKKSSGAIEGPPIDFNAVDGRACLPTHWIRNPCGHCFLSMTTAVIPALCLRGPFLASLFLSDALGHPSRSGRDRYKRDSTKKPRRRSADV